MTTHQILISGGSVAGLTLAYWLRRYGFRPTIVERASALRSGGQPVDIRGAATEIVERMGVLPAISAAVTGTRGMSYLNRRGGVAANLDQAFGVVSADDPEIMRGDLVEILHSASPGIEIIYGDSVTGLTEAANGVAVTFEHAEPRTFDLVVGADGLHSNVRKLAFGPESEYVKHLGYYVAIFSTSNFLDLDRWGLYYNVPGRLASIYSTRDKTQARVMLGFASEQLSYDYRSLDEQREIIASRFADDGWVVPRLLKAMRTAPDFFFDSTSQVSMTRRTSGRVALVGDAGYCASPLSGQGSSAAIVGAYVLAGELMRAHGDFGAAFARYEAQLERFIELNQKLAVSNGKWFAPSSGMQIWFRNLNMRMLPKLPWRDAILKQATQEIREASTAVVVEDYERRVVSR